MRSPRQVLTVGPLCSVEQPSRVPNVVISKEKAIWLLSFNSSLSASLFLHTTRNLPLFLATFSSLSEWYYKAPARNDMVSKVKGEKKGRKMI